MGNKPINLKDRIAVIGDVRSASDMRRMVEAYTPIVFDLDKLEKNQARKKAA